MSVFSTNRCVPYVCLVPIHRGEKRASDSLALVLGIVVNHHIGAGNQTWALCKNNKCSQPMGHLPSPALFLIYGKFIKKKLLQSS